MMDGMVDRGIDRYAVSNVDELFGGTCQLTDPGCVYMSQTLSMRSLWISSLEISSHLKNTFLSFNLALFRSHFLHVGYAGRFIFPLSPSLFTTHSTFYHHLQRRLPFHFNPIDPTMFRISHSRTPSLTSTSTDTDSDSDIDNPSSTPPISTPQAAPIHDNTSGDEELDRVGSSLQVEMESTSISETPIVVPSNDSTVEGGQEHEEVAGEIRLSRAVYSRSESPPHAPRTGYMWLKIPLFGKQVRVGSIWVGGEDIH
jgi:hypothetical protein